jgi:DNA-binding NtrC family response regulator
MARASTGRSVVRTRAPSEVIVMMHQSSEVGMRASLREQLRSYEIGLIREALDHAGGNQINAAALLRIPLRTLVYKLRKYNLQKLAALQPVP